MTDPGLLPRSPDCRIDQASQRQDFLSAVRSFLRRHPSSECLSATPARNRCGIQRTRAVLQERQTTHAVDVTTAASVSVGQPRVLFDRQYQASQLPNTNQTFDVSSDGQRILMLKGAATKSQ